MQFTENIDPDYKKEFEEESEEATLEIKRPQLNELQNK